MWGLSFCVGFYSLFSCNEMALLTKDCWHFHITEKLVNPTMHNTKYSHIASLEDEDWRCEWKWKVGCNWLSINTGYY